MTYATLVLLKGNVVFDDSRRNFNLVYLNKINNPKCGSSCWMHEINFESITCNEYILVIIDATKHLTK